MRLWFSRKKPQIQLRTVALPGEVGTISIPDDFTLEWEGAETLLAYHGKESGLAFRISAISFTRTDGNENAAMEFVRTGALERGHDYSESGDKGIAAYEESSGQDGVPLLIKYWNIGQRNTLVILSATIDRRREHASSVKQVLECVPAMLESVVVTKLHKILEADGKRIEVTEEAVQEQPQEIQPFSDADTAWLEAALDHAGELGVKYGSGGELTPAELDRVFGRWAHDEEPKETADQVADALGAAFGAYLVEHHGFHWRVLHDEFGAEYAVQHEVGSTMAFPRASVMKRIEDGQVDFFDSLYAVILDHLDEMSNSER